MTSLVRIFTCTDGHTSQSVKAANFNLEKESKAAYGVDGEHHVLFVTSNQGKLREVKQILGTDFPFHIETVSLDLEEIQHEDPDMIAIKKCTEAVKCLNYKRLIIEDSCLSFKAMDGLPGPYVKWFEKTIGNEGLVRMLSGFRDKSASAICTISYWDGQQMFVFKGVVQGTIVEGRGLHTSFGWDPIFMPSDSDQTFAEMGPEAKNKISHRVRALELLKNHLMLEKH